MPITARREQPAPSTPTRAMNRPRVDWACFAAGLLTAGLLWLSYFPSNWGWLGWVALVPWLMLVRAELRNALRYSIAWLSGLALFVPALSWMRVAHESMFYSWLGLALYCSWYFPLALWLIRRLDRRTRLPLTLTVPLVWTALEYVRSTLAGGFAWYLLGQTQHAALPVIQVADLAGVLGVTFLVAAVNGLAAEAVSRLAFVRAAVGWPADGGRARLRPQAVGVAAALAAVLVYGGWRLSQDAGTPGPHVALLQTRIYQNERLAADSAAQSPDREQARESVQEQTGRLTVQATESSPKPDLIIWPETTFPADWKDVAANAPAGEALTKWREEMDFLQRDVHRVAENTGTNILLGLNSWVFGAEGKPRRFNSAVLVSPTAQTTTRYDKIHLVPFGEYVPLRDTLPFLKELAPYDYDYSLAAGDMPTRFRLPAGGREYTFGVLICYEDSDAPLARQYVRPGEPPVDFLVNISNDGWFMHTAEHAQHLAVSRFRAVECRRALVRAVNGGISAVLDGSGRVVALPAHTWAASAAVPAVVSAAVPIDARTSLYARLGDWLPWGCWGLVLVGMFWRRGGGAG